MTTTTLDPTRREPVRATAGTPVRVARPSGERVAQAVALLGSLSAAVLLTYTVVALPNRLLLSEYVHVPGGLEPFVGGLLALAAAALAAARSVRVREAAAAAVLRVSGAAAVMAAAFPTDATHLAAPSLSAQVHRYAALVVFVGLPTAGWLLVRSCDGVAARVLRGLAALSGVAVVATLLLHPSSPVAAVVGHTGWEGVSQRLVAATDVVLVGVMAVLSRPRQA
jgi:hypothetical protein